MWVARSPTSFFNMLARFYHNAPPEDRLRQMNRMINRIGGARAMVRAINQVVIHPDETQAALRYVGNAIGSVVRRIGDHGENPGSDLVPSGNGNSAPSSNELVNRQDNAARRQVNRRDMARQQDRQRRGSKRKRGEEPPSQSNMPTDGKSKGDHQDEVQVMPHYGPMSKIIEDYHTITLSYYERRTVFKSAGTAAGIPETAVFRLNSIFDVNETRAGSNVPLGRDTWASIYQYYRVLSSTLNIELMNRQNVNTLIGVLILEEDSTNIVDDITTNMMRKNAFRTIIPGNQFSNPSIGSLGYSYNPSGWDHHVQETGVEERWTPINQTPSNEHKAVMRVVGADYDETPAAGAVPGEVDFEYYVHMKFVVQFREANNTILTQGTLPS